ncbi:MAG: FAD:protein FMN transferase [Mariniblastus sp.]|nr:FAD:protein FMN transferase [Mariniblastus sp.]
MHTFFGYLGILCSTWLFLLPGALTGNEKNRGPGTRQEFSFPAMGVEFRVIYYAAPQGVDRIEEQIRQRVNQIEQALSDYRASSEVSLLGQSAPHATPQKTGPDLWKLSCTSRAISRHTDGAFDITVGNLSHLWRMARKRNRLPTPEKIASARERTGYRQLEIHSNQRLRLTEPGMRLDFGGIAKGYAADEVIGLLQQQGIRSALVDAGGDICVSDAPPGRTDWTIRLLQPDGKPGAKAVVELKLANAAVATSGDLNQFLVIDGKRYSHIIDPRTGQATTRISMVTVKAPTATLADAYASAVSVAGVPDGLALVNDLCRTECLVWVRGSERDAPLQRFTSRGWGPSGSDE